jgi:two-component system alkaline phosphatase synthesis response regulator PhoP
MNDIPRILIAEDDPLIAQLYKTTLTANGFIVEFAFDGKEVMAYLNKAKQLPDLLLLDLLMPKLNGYDVLQQIKHNPTFKNIPIVVLSNLMEWQNAEKALELGASLYMVKSSYTPKEIVMKIKEVLAGQTNDNNSKFETKISTKDIPLPKK